MAALAEDIGEDDATVRMWKYRRAIPANYDVRIVNAAKTRNIFLSFETLARIRAGESADAA